jgi:cobalt-zinc-cadmium resistance protein CzcA
VYTSQKALYKSQTKSNVLAHDLTKWEIEKEVALIYYDLLVMREKRNILREADSLYTILSNLESQRFAAGDANVIDKAGVETAKLQIHLQLEQLNADYQSQQLALGRLMNSGQMYEPQNISAKMTLQNVPDTALYLNHPLIKWTEQKQQMALDEIKVSRYKLLPQFNVGYNNQSINGYMKTNTGDVFYGSANRFNSAFIGLNIPLFFNSGAARINASKENLKLSKIESDDNRSKQKMEYQQLLIRYKNYGQSIDSYEQTALKQARTLQTAANQKFMAGSISYIEWMMLVNQSMSIEAEYLNMLSRWNKTMTELNSYFPKN